jgi:hypothetical protein
MNQTRPFQDQIQESEQTAEQVVRVREVCGVASDLVRWGVMSRAEAASWLRMQLFLLGVVASAEIPLDAQASRPGRRKSREAKELSQAELLHVRWATAYRLTKKYGSFTRVDYQKALNTSKATAQRDIHAMLRRGVLCCVRPRYFAWQPPSQAAQTKSTAPRQSSCTDLQVYCPF